MHEAWRQKEPYVRIERWGDRHLWDTDDISRPRHQHSDMPACVTSHSTHLSVGKVLLPHVGGPGEPQDSHEYFSFPCCKLRNRQGNHLDLQKINVQILHHSATGLFTLPSLTRPRRLAGHSRGIVANNYCCTCNVYPNFACKWMQQKWERVTVQQPSCLWKQALKRLYKLWTTIDYCQ